MICPFCFQSADNPKPWCVENPGHGCTYGMHHEFDSPVQEAPKQVKKQDRQLCLTCGLHQKNPASATSSCQHQYPQ